MNMNFIIAKETIHKGQGFMAGTIIDNLADEGHWEVVFGTGVIEIMKFNEDVNSSLFFVDRDGVGDP
jgi:hypothetical protein